MRLSLTTVTTLAAMLAAGSANAAGYTKSTGFTFEPYVGADYDSTHFRDAPFGIEENYNGGNVHAGVRLHDYFGAEVGYFATETGTDSSLGTQVDSKFDGANVDLMLYAPMNDSFELIGSVGASYTSGQVDVAGFGSAEGDDWDARYGVGAQYWLSENLNARAMVHYTDDPEASDVVTTSVGLNYQF